MKIFHPVLRGVLCLALAAVLSGCAAMKSVSKSLGHTEVFTEIMIEATPEEVWAVITDAESYGHWNPVIIEAEGSYALGATIRNMVVEDGKDPVAIKSRVELFDAPRHLNQFGGYVGVITFDHHYILEPVEGGTRVVQREDYTGFYLHFWDSDWVTPAYNRVNRALRDEVLRRKALASES